MVFGLDDDDDDDNSLDKDGLIKSYSQLVKSLIENTEKMRKDFEKITGTTISTSTSGPQSQNTGKKRKLSYEEKLLGVNNSSSNLEKTLLNIDDRSSKREKERDRKPNFLEKLYKKYEFEKLKEQKEKEKGRKLTRIEEKMLKSRYESGHIRYEKEKKSPLSMMGSVLGNFIGNIFNLAKNIFSYGVLAFGIRSMVKTIWGLFGNQLEMILPPSLVNAIKNIEPFFQKIESYFPKIIELAKEGLMFVADTVIPGILNAVGNIANTLINVTKSVWIAFAPFRDSTYAKKFEEIKKEIGKYWNLLTETYLNPSPTDKYKENLTKEIGKYFSLIGEQFSKTWKNLSEDPAIRTLVDSIVNGFVYIFNAVFNNEKVKKAISDFGNRIGILIGNLFNEFFEENIKNKDWYKNLIKIGEGIIKIGEGINFIFEKAIEFMQILKDPMGFFSSEIKRLFPKINDELKRLGQLGKDQFQNLKDIFLPPTTPTPTPPTPPPTPPPPPPTPPPPKNVSLNVLTPLNGIAGIIAGAAQSIAAATINSNNAVALEGANGSNTTNVLLSEAINTLSVIAQKINQPPKGIDDNRSYVSSSGLPGYYDVFNMS